MLKWEGPQSGGKLRVSDEQMFSPVEGLPWRKEPSVDCAAEGWVEGSAGVREVAQKLPLLIERDCEGLVATTDGSDVGKGGGVVHVCAGVEGGGETCVVRVNAKDGEVAACVVVLWLTHQAKAEDREA